MAKRGNDSFWSKNIILSKLSPFEMSCLTFISRVELLLVYLWTATIVEECWQWIFLNKIFYLDLTFASLSVRNIFYYQTLIHFCGKIVDIVVFHHVFLH